MRTSCKARAIPLDVYKRQILNTVNIISGKPYTSRGVRAVWEGGDASPAKDELNQMCIRDRYNDSLQCCRKGSEDVAVIQLKKILNQNPKLIKGYHLLADVYKRQPMTVVVQP